MLSKIELDETDKVIVALLQDNARITIKEIAARLGLTTTPIYERIKRLERSGVLSKYVALVNEKLINKNLLALVQISLDKHSKDAVNQVAIDLSVYPEVMECFHITGDSDFFLKVAIDNMEAYHQFVLEKLSIVPHIRTVKSQFVLSKRKHTTAYSLDVDI